MTHHQGSSDSAASTSTDSIVSTYSGQCLCGAVTLRLQHPGPVLAACHCGICRRWGGGPSMTVECQGAPLIEGMEHVRMYSSSDWAERGFCSGCGTHLFYRLKQGGFYAVSVGLFAQSADWPFELQVFIDDKPGNYEYANITRKLTGEDVFKAWSPD